MCQCAVLAAIQKQKRRSDSEETNGVGREAEKGDARGGHASLHRTNGAPLRSSKRHASKAAMQAQAAAAAWCLGWCWDGAGVHGDAHRAS